MPIPTFLSGAADVVQLIIEFQHDICASLWIQKPLMGVVLYL